MKQSKTDIFIEKARAKHGGRYDYSLAVYTKGTAKVTIICSVHGAFQQSASSHMQGKGCRFCNGKTKLSTSEFISKACAIHGDTYDYSKSNYLNTRTPIIITCKKHGDYTQVPNVHLSGSGCTPCGQMIPSTEEFVANARLVHGDLYDYSKTKYVFARNQVVITCPAHGDFRQTPDNHLRGNKCVYCSGNKLDRSAFLSKCFDTHGDRYSYDKVEFVTVKDHVTVTCREHGDFDQLAGTHMYGASCPECQWDYDQKTYLYVMQAGECVKIGISINPNIRLIKLNRVSPFGLHIVKTWPVDGFKNAQRLEGLIHSELKSAKVSFEGFDGCTEYFKVSPDVANSVISAKLDTGWC